MEILLFTGIVSLLLLGLIFSVIPSLPVPLFLYFALLLDHFFINKFKNNSIILIGIGIFIISILDYFLQIYAVKVAGVDRYTIRGSIIGFSFGIILKLAISFYIIYFLLFK